MGIEVLIITVIIIGVLGAGAYLYSNIRKSKTVHMSETTGFRIGSPKQQAPADPELDGISRGGMIPDTEKKIEVKEEAKNDQADRKRSPASEDPAKPKPVPAPAPGSPPPPPPRSSSSDGLIAGGKLDLFGGIGGEPEPALPDDKPEKKKAKKGSQLGGQSPEEIMDWMDNLQEQREEAEEELPSFDDAEEDADMDDTPDTEYPEKKTVSATTAHFSVFYPKEAQAEQRYGVYIYAHAESMLAKITEDAQKFKEELGGHVPQPRIAKASKSLVHGTKITVLLESEDIEFEPDMLTKRWYGDWTRYEFEFRPNAELVNETAFVRASIMVMGFEIAKIKFAIDITEPQTQAMVVEGALPTNPFARAKMQSATTAGYDKIFISYSRKDKLIAEAFKIIQEAAGNDVFFDVDDIRTGEDWKVAIARAIDEADYLQLFWSENSANSEWCGYEWEYTLNYRCQENKCREFIRPVWWNAPMPPPPESLGHLNFRRMDFEKLMQLDER